MGGLGTGTDETTKIPWAPQGAQFQQLYQRADQFVDQPREYYPGSTIAPRSRLETQAVSNIESMVGAGSEDLRAAQTANRATLAGDYLTPDSNPYLRQVGEAAAGDITRQYQRAVMPGISSRFAGAGRSAGVTGGPNAETSAMAAANRGLGQELSQMYASLYGGAYEAERGRQVGAVGAAPGLRQAEFGEQTALASAGRDDFKYAQLQLSDLVDRFNFGQNEFYERLGRFQGLISQPGGYGTSETRGELGPAQIIGAFGAPLSGLGGQ